jgi:IclR family transcriptional regulator, KDG regulon repressor
LVRRTSRTIVEPRGLGRELARIRAEGFAKDLEESEPGVRCIAAAVFYGGASPIAAISISAPRERLPNGTMPDVAALLVRETSGVAVP